MTAQEPSKEFSLSSNQLKLTSDEFYFDEVGKLVVNSDKIKELMSRMPTTRREEQSTEAVSVGVVVSVNF